MRIAIIGGGRWAKTHISVLSSLMDGADHMDWFTERNFEENTQWLQSINYNPTIKIQNYSVLLNASYDGYIVTTDSQTHAHYLRKLIPTGKAILCEKPLCYSFQEGQELAKLADNNQCPVAMNIEFIHASYLDDFKKAIATRPIKKIEIDWQDPLTEDRNGITKYSDIVTPISFDQGTHCWSILSYLLDNQTFSILTASYQEDGSIMVEAQYNHIDIHLTLGRFAHHRTRRVSINNNEVVLDFSTEPGRIITPERSYCNKWRDHRPMTLALSSFLQIVKNKKTQLPELIHNILPCLKFCEDVQDLLNVNLKNHLLSPNLGSENYRKIIIYYYAPLLMTKGFRSDVFSDTGYADFLDQIQKYKTIHNS